MLQTGAVISELSVREVLTMLASLYPDPMPVDDVIAAADIADIAGRRTNKLSGGQTQRVRFALALVSNPRLLVLDEPTVALDVEARRAFWATMRGFASDGRTVVFATHYLEEADAYADRIVLMANGVDRRRRLDDARSRRASGAARSGRRCPTSPSPSWRRCPASSRPTATATPSSCRAPTPTPPSAPCSRPAPTSTTSRSAAPPSRTPSSS